MKTLVLAIICLVPPASTSASAGPLYAFGIGDAAPATFCAAKDVSVLTASPEDCGKIGGTATHKITHTVTPSRIGRGQEGGSTEGCSVEVPEPS